MYKALCLMIFVIKLANSPVKTPPIMAHTPVRKWVNDLKKILVSLLCILFLNFFILVWVME